MSIHLLNTSITFDHVFVLYYLVGELIATHRMKLYPLILNQTRHSPTILEEVCDALLDMDFKDFIQSAVPAVLPQLIMNHNDGTLEEV